MPRSAKNLDEQQVCFGCIGDKHLRALLKAQAHLSSCSFCEAPYRSTVALSVLGEAVDTAFTKHFREAEQVPHFDSPDDKVYFTQGGDELNDCIQQIADVSYEIAEALGEWMADNTDDDPRDGGTARFTGDTGFESTPIDTSPWDDEWAKFVNACQHDARFFSPRLRQALERLFGKFSVFLTSPIVKVTPGHALSTVYRARPVESVALAKKFALDAAKELGPPPAALASPGRMNPGGISVLYAAFSEDVAVAEMRPSVGGLLAVARFRIVRPLRLLDFSAFQGLEFSDSYFKPGFVERAGKRQFLQGIGAAIARPIQQHEQILEYVPIQILTEFLHRRHRLDGLIYPSAQYGSADPKKPKGSLDRNVVLFHHAARVQHDPPVPDDPDKRVPSIAVILGEFNSRALASLTVSSALPSSSPCTRQAPLPRALCFSPTLPPKRRTAG